MIQSDNQNLKYSSKNKRQEKRSKWPGTRIADSIGFITLAICASEFKVKWDHGMLTASSQRQRTWTRGCVEWRLRHILTYAGYCLETVDAQSFVKFCKLLLADDRLNPYLYTYMFSYEYQMYKMNKWRN